jgi:hypothetical protein
VPEPEVPDSRPEPTARFNPLFKATLMLPASATRPEAVTMALVEATSPLLMPIETLDPPPQAVLRLVSGRQVPPGKLNLTVGKLSPVFDHRRVTGMRELPEDFAGFPASRIQRQRICLRRLHARHPVCQIAGANEHRVSPWAISRAIMDARA